MKVFFIFSQYRTGSKLLCSLLDSHPEITCIHESLSPRNGVIERLGCDETGDWRDIASAISRDHPDSRYIGLHGQADMLTDEELNASTEKIALYREDVVLGGVKQTLMDIERVNLGFALNADLAHRNIDMRKERDEVIHYHSTMKLSYEQMTGGENITSLPFDLNKKLLKHIGASNYRLIATTEKQRQTLPNNMEEIRHAGKG